MALSLQDTCLLNILLRVNQFPVEYLAVLPRAIRQRLFDHLPRADILHLGNTALFSDLNCDEVEDALIETRERIVGVILQSSRLREIVSLRGSEYYTDSCCFPRDFESMFASLEPNLECYENRVVPKHLFEMWIDHSSRLSNSSWPLLHYCNVYCAPPKLTINCYDFKKMMYFENSSDLAIPFLQEFLSNVEELELYSGFIGSDFVVPYLLLYSSNQPRLKHLKVHGDSCLVVAYNKQIRENLVSRIPKPYQLESIKIRLSVLNERARYIQCLIEYQIGTLRSVTINIDGLLDQNFTFLFCLLNQFEKATSVRVS